MPESRLALGTVQFGLRYGIANELGRVSDGNAAAILNLAHKFEIDTLDTAISYGGSEAVIGTCGANRFKLITKLPALPEDVTSVADWVDAQVDASLKRLRISRLEGVLLHHPDQLASPFGSALYSALVGLKKSGRTRRIGISIYEPCILDRLEHLHFDLVQAPLNVLDTRILASGWIERLASRRCELHVRSAFLQGLLLMEPGKRPKEFSDWDSAWKAWDAWLREYNLSPLEACLRFVLSVPGVAKVVVGVDSEEHLRAIALAANGPMPELPSELSKVSTHLLNPGNWSRH